MMFDPSQVVGLTQVQRRVYEAAVQFVARRGIAPTRRDITRAIAHRSDGVQRAFGTLVKRGYVRRLRDGQGMLPLMPPHERALLDICTVYNLTVAEIRGSERTLRMQRVRREFANRMRREFHYSYKAIGIVLGRNHATVEVFCKPQERRRRSINRAAKYRAAATERRAEARA